MKDRLFGTIYNHFQTYFKVNCGPILLAFSGGSDSTALLQGIEQLPHPIDLHIAHVDHGWRANSHQQAKSLEKRYRKYPFHLKRLEKMEGGNLEERARVERYRFFEDLQAKHHYQAVVLAHHATDLAETALKRLFEGSQTLSTMRPCSTLGIMTIWRPLLSMTKEQMLSCTADYIDDPTNRDPRFLRARMREQMMPQLESLFGKNIQKNLCRFAKRSQEIEEYLDKRIGKVLEKEKIVPIARFEGMEPLEIKHYLKRWQPSLSREAIETLARLIEQKKWGSEVSMGEKSLGLFKDKLSLVCYTAVPVLSCVE